MQKKIEPQVVEAERVHCRLLAEAMVVIRTADNKWFRTK